jgi:hypothetical protein
VQNKTDGDNPKSGGKIPDLPNRLKTTTHKVGDGEWGDILNTSQIGEPSLLVPRISVGQSADVSSSRHFGVIRAYSWFSV